MTFYRAAELRGPTTRRLFHHPRPRQPSAGVGSAAQGDSCRAVVDPEWHDSIDLSRNVPSTLHGAEFVDRVLATVLFTDIVGSTELLVRVGDKAWHDLLARYHAHVRSALAPFRGREVDAAGDGFFATFDAPARAVRCALCIHDVARKLGIAIRAGLHTGEIELDRQAATGIAVHIGARVASMAEANETLVSSTVKELVCGSGLHFEDRGAHVLKGVPGRWRLYAAS